MDQSDDRADDRAGKAYWNDLWEGQPLPEAIDPRDPARRNYVNRMFDKYMRELFMRLARRGGKLLEIGCGSSVWLPYFGREYGFLVTGLDYSPEGCARAAAILHRDGVDGTVHRTDLFDAPPELSEAFDVVVSFGVVEHFDDTDRCIGAVSGFAAPGGLVLTMIPNMRGIPGLIQRALNRKVYDAHVPLTPGRLAEAHAHSGLDVLESRYFISMNFGVNNLVGLDPTRRSTRIKGLILRMLNLLSLMVWELERLIGKEMPASRLLSPYVITAAVRSRNE